MSIYSIPDDLIPITEKQILKEVADKKKLTLEQVEFIYKCMLGFLKKATRNEGQLSVVLSKFGKFYYNKYLGKGAIDNLKNADKRLTREQKNELISYHKKKIQESLDYNEEKKDYYRDVLRVIIAPMVWHCTRPLMYRRGFDRVNRDRKMFNAETCSYIKHDEKSLIKTQIDNFFKNDHKYMLRPDIKEVFFGDLEDYDKENTISMAKYIDDMYDKGYYDDLLREERRKQRVNKEQK